MTLLEHRLDMPAVMRLALRGVELLADTDPTVARRMRTAIQTQGGAALHVARWEDGEAAIAVCGVQVWSGPLESILRRLDA